MFLLRISGTGKVFLWSFGAIHEIDLGADQGYIVDTGHMVACAEGVEYGVKGVGGLKSTMFNGEGLVCEFSGPGKVMIESKSEESFLSWLIPKVPKKG